MMWEEREERSKVAPDIEAILLRDALDALNVCHTTFAPGMIVRQKRQARLYKMLGDNDLAIVVRMLPEPIMSQESSVNNTLYRHEVDMVIGSIEYAGIDRQQPIFATFHVDSRRFEPVPDAEMALSA
jgi:hypothetical protein